MNITAKAKDDTLKGILEGTMGCDKDMEAVLEADGYISVIRTNMANVCQITPSGRAFIAQGGYSAIEKKKEELLMKAEAAKERERQIRLQEIEIQRIVSLELMKKEHEFQIKQNKANRRSNIVAAFISAVISVIVTLITQAL